MKAQGICPVCGAAVGVKPGDVAVIHSRRGAYGGRWRCSGAGKVANVGAWIDGERARLATSLARSEPRREALRTELAASLARLDAADASDRKELAALDRLTAQRSTGGAR